MRDYAKVSPTFWTGTTGRALRGQGPEAVIVALYLMTAPGSNMLGIYYQPILYMAHETGLGFEGASKGLAGCIEGGFCQYDAASEVVWVVEMASYQVAPKLKAADNRCAGIQKEVDALAGHCFLTAFHARYAAAFNLAPLGFIEAPSEALPSQEQEQEHKEQVKDSCPTATPQDQAANRLAQVTDEATAAYNEILAKPNGRLARALPASRAIRTKNIRRCVALAREICEAEYGSATITPEFWSAYWGACSDDPFLSGEGPYTGDHAKWRPRFEYLTRPDVMAKVFEDASGAAA